MLTAVIFSEYSYALLFLFILIGAITEFSGLFKQSSAKPNVWLSYILSVALFSTTFFSAKGIIETKYLLGILPLFLVIMAAELYRKKEKPVENISITVF